MREEEQETSGGFIERIVGMQIGGLLAELVDRTRAPPGQNHTIVSNLSNQP